MLKEYAKRRLNTNDKPRLITFTMDLIEMPRIKRDTNTKTNILFKLQPLF